MLTKYLLTYLPSLLARTHVHYRNLLSEIRRKINETQVQDTVVTQKEQKKITNDTEFLLKEVVNQAANQQLVPDD